MSHNIFQFIEVERVEQQKKSPKRRKGEFAEIYRCFGESQVQMQSDRCIECGNPYCEWKCPVHNYIPDWLRLAREGKIIEAAELSHRTNALPEICWIAELAGHYDFLFGILSRNIAEFHQVFTK